MPRDRYALLLLLGLNCALSQPAVAQTLLADVAAGTAPVALALNSTTNKVFVVNQGSNNLTVLDGLTYRTVTVNVGLYPSAVAVNPSTNKIYVANTGDNTVTVVDGNSVNSPRATVPTGTSPVAIAVNQFTNKIYVANNSDNTVTAFDGYSNFGVAPIRVGIHPQALAINPTTNKIYVANFGDGTVTVIDGTSNLLHTRIYTGAERSLRCGHQLADQPHLRRQPSRHRECDRRRSIRAAHRQRRTNPA